MNNRGNWNKESNKIKDGDEFELFGVKIIAKNSCPPNIIYVVDEKLFKFNNRQSRKATKQRP